MTTPLIMLGLLVGPSALNVLIARLAGRRLLDAASAGCVGIALVFCFTGAGHFVQTKPMAEMLPPWVPSRIPLVYLTGVLELILAAAVLIRPLRRLVGRTLIVMLILFLPVNVYAAMNRIGMGGHEWGPIYLLIRVPLQLVLIVWIWWFAVQKTSDAERYGG
ncbi:MAG: hypothetical protein M3552_00845 [Planctomycetota bacterium]|nr:hypothetical protein [Planctomycetaceae bacterium]MDQ3329192.1 hypothetical protein [Planctomycetota bacterium]